jgi:hypothetical protein
MSAEPFVLPEAILFFIKSAFDKTRILMPSISIICEFLYASLKFSPST